MFKNIAFLFPSCFILRMIFPLDFIKFHHFVPSDSLFFIQDFDKVLNIGKIRLERESFNFHHFIGNSQTLFQLGDMENIMDYRQNIRELDTINNSTTPFQNFLRSDIMRS